MQDSILPSGLPALVGVGGGKMGAGIAHAFLIKGADVVIVKRDEESAPSCPSPRSIRRPKERRERHH